MVAELCSDLQIHINGQQTFFISQKIMSSYSRKIRKLTKMQENKELQIAFNDFPGGGAGFELVSRFCYNNGEITIATHNVCSLYCGAIYLGMEDTLMQKTEAFLKGIFYSHNCWEDLLICLRSCEPFFSLADSSGLINNLISNLLSKIAQNNENSLFFSPTYYSPSSDSSTMAGLGKPKAWWFDDLATLSPLIIQKVATNVGAYGSNNNNLLLTRFLLHYLKTNKNFSSKSDLYSGLADSAVYGVILMAKISAFSCRTLFWVLRLGSWFGLSKVCKSGLEKLIGSMLDLAKLDDLLVSSTGHNTTNCNAGVYDVNLVVRLVRGFIQCQGISLERSNKVARLIDQYLAEISPDHNLKISKFMAVAQSLPDMARDCFDGVYRAIDIYLESHPTLSFEDRARICQCLNYEKLSLQACKDLAKNPRIPPRVAIQALASQKHANCEFSIDHSDYFCKTLEKKRSKNYGQIVYCGNKGVASSYEREEMGEKYEVVSNGSQDVRLNTQRMQWRLVELEKLCREMKGQMSKLVRHNNKFIYSFIHSKPIRLC